MAQSLSKIIVHVVSSTKNRHPFLRAPTLRDELNRYIGGILIKLDCQPIIVGSVEDHVHFLCSLSRTCEPAHLVKEVKRGSSIWLKTKGPELEDFAWQNGYGIFSIGFSQIESARSYIAGQEEHHKQVSFQDEFASSCSDTKSPLTNGMFGIDPTLAGLTAFSLTQGRLRQPWAE